MHLLIVYAIITGTSCPTTYNANNIRYIQHNDTSMVDHVIDLRDVINVNCSWKLDFPEQRELVFHFIGNCVRKKYVTAILT